MGQATVVRTLEMARRLSVGELREVEQGLRRMLASAQQEAGEAERLDAALIGAGLVAKVPSVSPTERRDRPLASIKGAPLSQTVVEDRR
ncbi:MAG: hypothetical protein NT029_08575 [Armatimonadetes bacterium]|nr:hypothetical protein [Armatimonadota bacterium]